MQYKFLSPVQKVNGEKLEEVELKESFTGRDVRAIGNAGGEGSATIALVSAAGLGLDDGFAILAGVFHWPYGDIMALDAESFAYSVRDAEKFLKWKSPKR